MKDVKSEKFVSSYFYDMEKLVNSIKGYRKLHAMVDEYCLFDLLITLAESEDDVQSGGVGSM